MTDPQTPTYPDHATLDTPELTRAIGPLLVQALLAKGFQSLTRVQAEVLDPSLSQRDLRISSQTGSGKTVAIGLVLRDVVAPPASEAGDVVPERRGQAKSAEPRAIVVVPTRELAAQVQVELSWLYRGLEVRVASVTGGASYRDEHRALARGPAVVVGTPGRLLDHLTRGVIDTTHLGAVVLDEADQMLDLGFRDELDAIFEHLPENRRTHLVSATFARDVMALADRVQRQPVHVEGTPLGSANADIDHVVHVIEPSQRIDALINVLLCHPDDQTLIFARTRADVAETTRELLSAGFAAGALSGEMDQAARNGALAAFKRGQLRALVATDVAARGIDVQNIARVVQIDAPPNPDSYTHRSGRTGRAGRKGVSVLLITRGALRRTEQVLARARVKARIEPVPTADAIRAAQDARLLGELCAPVAGEASERVQRQVARIIEGGHTEVALARLVSQLQRTLGEPRHVSKVTVKAPREQEARRSRDSRPHAGAPRGGAPGWARAGPAGANGCPRLGFVPSHLRAGSRSRPAAFGGHVVPAWSHHRQRHRSDPSLEHLLRRRGFRRRPRQFRRSRAARRSPKPPRECAPAHARRRSRATEAGFSGEASARLGRSSSLSARGQTDGQEKEARAEPRGRALMPRTVPTERPWGRWHPCARASN